MCVWKYRRLAEQLSSNMETRDVRQNKWNNHYTPIPIASCFSSPLLLPGRSRLPAPADPQTGDEVHGLCSNYLADVKPGDELVMTGPAGTALLLADNPWNKRIVCVSTGACVSTVRFWQALCDVSAAAHKSTFACRADSPTDSLTCRTMPCHVLVCMRVFVRTKALALLPSDPFGAASSSTASLASQHSPSLTTPCSGCCLALQTLTGESVSSRYVVKSHCCQPPASTFMQPTPSAVAAFCASVALCVLAPPLTLPIHAHSAFSMEMSSRLLWMPTPSTCASTLPSAWSSRTHREAPSTCRTASMSVHRSFWTSWRLMTPSFTSVA